MIGCIFALAIWAFNSNVRNRMSDIRDNVVVRDEMDLFSKKDKGQLAELSRAFDKNFGVKLSIRILRGAPPEQRKYAPVRVITVSMYPEVPVAQLDLPPLVLAAVGEPLRRELENVRLQQAMEQNRALEGLVLTLKIIWEKIGSAGSETG
jgi:hypothetical protein